MREHFLLKVFIWGLLMTRNIGSVWIVKGSFICIPEEKKKGLQHRFWECLSMHQGIGSDKHRLTEGRAIRARISKISVTPLSACSHRKVSYICANKSWEKPKGDSRNDATCNHALEQWQVLRSCRGVCGNHLLNKHCVSFCQIADLPTCGMCL